MTRVRSTMRRARGGMTIIELLVVLTIIGILVRIALPEYSSLKRRALAAQVLGDVEAIRVAAFGYYADAGQFPAQAGNGKVPAEITSYLPNGFTFKAKNGTYRWYVWTVTTGKGKTKVKQDYVGVKVTPADTKMVTTLANMVGPAYASIVTTSDVTFLVSDGS